MTISDHFQPDYVLFITNTNGRTLHQHFSTEVEASQAMKEWKTDPITLRVELRRYPDACTGETVTEWTRPSIFQLSSNA